MISKHTNLSTRYFHSLIIFVTSIVIILLFWAILPVSLRQNDSSDYLGYYEPVARSVLSGKGIFLTNGAVAFSYPPGYPIILAGIFSFSRSFGISEEIAYSTFSLLCVGFSSTLIFLLSEKFWGIRGGYFSAFFFMTYPFMIWLTKQPNSELPFMVVFYSSLYMFWLGLSNKKGALLFLGLSGILAGVGMLIRAIAIGTGSILFGLFLILSKNIPLKKRILLGSVILLGNLLIVLPWQVWLYGKTGKVVLLASNSVPSIRDGLTFAVDLKDYRQNIELPENIIQLQNVIGPEISSTNSFGGLFKVIGKHFKEEPLVVIHLVMIKLGRSWYGTDSGSMETTIMTIQLVYGSLVLLATVLVWRRRVELVGLLLFVYVFVFYFWFMTTLVLSILRYMTPTIGLLSLLIPVVVFDLHRRTHHEY